MLEQQNISPELSPTNRDILPQSLRGGSAVYRRNSYIALKVCFEWLLSLALLLLLGPLLAILAILVRTTSRGPAFYAQRRLGHHGSIFKIFKLRTMIEDAEEGTGPVWAATDDRRVTYIGAFLRKTHLDELPQLLNVLRGEMGLIGPRPERPELAAQIVQRLPTFSMRLEIRPGLTGLAQVLLPADDPNDEAMDCVRRKLECDLIYISQMRPFLDIRIYICTACQLVTVVMDVICRAVIGDYAQALSRSDDTSSGGNGEYEELRLEN